MKQLIIGIVLAVCLVGCGEKPKFSLNKDDTLEVYANNPAFTKIKVSLTSNEKEKNGKFGYKFTGAPTSVYGIETGDLNVIGGIIMSSPANEKNIVITLTMKGKENFDKLEKRLDELKGFTCNGNEIGDSRGFFCNMEQQARIILSVNYDSFSDITSFIYTEY